MPDTEEPPVLYERRGAIGIATLNRPQRLNPMSSAMIEELHRIVNTMATTEGKALIVTAAGRGFCSGMDVHDMATPMAERPKSRLTWPRPHADMYPASLFRSADIPIIGAINGVAAGAGMSFALCPDIRLMSDEARMIPIFLKRGLMPDMGMPFLLTQIVGTQKALELMWAAEPLSPQQCLELGLVSRIVPHDRLIDEAVAMAEKLASGPSMAIAYTKRAVYRSEVGTLEGDLEWGNLAQGKLMLTEDCAEGAKAFLEKREPHFKGR